MRKPYRVDRRKDIEQIEIQRTAAGLSVLELALTAGMSWNKLMYIRREGLAFPRDVRALKYALRTLQRRRR